MSFVRLKRQTLKFLTPENVSFKKLWKILLVQLGACYIRMTSLKLLKCCVNKAFC
jgi:hypothetical protein